MTSRSSAHFLFFLSSVLFRYSNPFSIIRGSIRGLREGTVTIWGLGALGIREVLSKLLDRVLEALEDVLTVGAFKITVGRL